MTDIEKFLARADLPARADRQHRRALAREQRGLEMATNNVKAETKLAGVRVDAAAALAGKIMERVVDIDSHRRALASNDETLNAILMRIELTFVAKAEQVQRGLGDGFDL